MHTSLRPFASTAGAVKAGFLHQPKTCAIVGAPFALGQPLVGVEKGPQAIRAAGLRHRIAKEQWRIEDLGDLSFPYVNVVQNNQTTNLRNAAQVGAANEVLFRQVYDHASQGKFMLTLGGDHSVGIGSIAGILRARPDVGIIWVDAHADINTAQTSSSGNIHGMAVSFLMNHFNCDQIPGFGWLARNNEQHSLSPQKIVYIGLRDLDHGEKHRIKDLGIKAFSMHHIDKYGIGKVMEMTLDHLLGKGPIPLHLSVDIDSVDPVFAPSTGTTVRGGLTDREAHYVCEAVCETTLLGSMDMVEVNPALVSADGANGTADMAARLVGAAMGDSIL